MTRAWAVALASAVLSRVAADGMIRNAEAYWVIDPTDQTCLTELGTFGACDDDALFMYLSRPVGFWDRLFRGAAQQWEMLQSNARRFAATTNEDAVAHVALTTNGQKDCVVRDSSIWSKAARLQRALSEGGSAGRERTPKARREHRLRARGFLFQSADGAMCYDGVRFACSGEDRTLRWGVGVRFSRGRPETSLYKFYNASESCLVEVGDHVALGSCDAKGARGWGVTKGRLCRGGDCVKSGKLAQALKEAAEREKAAEAAKLGSGRASTYNV
ncbi:hypothetical protein JL722_6488 [Aureococcus anophagefferens]|nr:hypothetical protein JL722_6488 [Aureococcus anophagefferens]